MPRPPSRGALQLSSGSGNWRDGDGSGFDPAEVVTRPGGTRPIAPVEERDGSRGTHAGAEGSSSILSGANSGTPGFPDAHRRVPGLGCAPLTFHSGRGARGAHRSGRV